MGLCFSLDQEELKARARSEVIDKNLQTWAKQDTNVIKILLLGAAEGGKSTLVKQMKIIHNDGFSKHELRSFKTAVLDNLVSSMKFVLAGMGMLRVNLENPKNKLYAQKILSCMCCYDKEFHAMLPEIYEALKSLWKDRGIRLAVSKGYEFELNDSAIYYFENMDRICSLKFQPSCKDVLRARVRTTGVIETCFKINGGVIRMFDVGGQRSERRKWIQCFDDVRCILFVAALSCYDLTLFEDPSVNRLVESLKLFRGISNNRFFFNTAMVNGRRTLPTSISYIQNIHWVPVVPDIPERKTGSDVTILEKIGLDDQILFLNKLDLFQDKVRHSGRHLRYYFPDYSGPDHDVDSAARYIQHLFTMQCNNPSKVIYPHFTTATDTSNIQVVFQVVMDSVLRENIKAVSIL